MEHPTLTIRGAAYYEPSQCFECSLPGEIRVGGVDLVALLVEKCPVADKYGGWARDLGNIKITIEYEGKAT